MSRYICLVVWLLSLGGCATTSPEDASREGVQANDVRHEQSDDGTCRLTAYEYDHELDCFRVGADLDEICFVEQEPDTTTGTAEIVCLLSPTGSYFAAVKGYTDCLAGADWAAEIGSDGRTHGWVVYGASGLCLADSSDSDICEAMFGRLERERELGSGVEPELEPTLEIEASCPE